MDLELLVFIGGILHFGILLASAMAPKRILVVDDEPGIRKLLHDILTDDGHQVELASTAAAAQDLMKQHEFDLLLLDLRMPGGDGRDLLEWVKKHDRELADNAIFLTGDTARAEVRTFVESTGNLVISKPFHLADLRTAISGLFPLDK